MKTCLDLLTDVGRFVGRPDNVYKERLRHNLNLAARAWTRQFPSPQNLRRQTIAATGAQVQGLPGDVDRPVFFVDATNNMPLIHGREWDRNYTQVLVQQTGGNVYEWETAGVHPVIEHPAGAYVTLESSASEARTVVLGGPVSDTAASGTGAAQYWNSDTVYLTGTTPVTNAVAFDQIQEFARTERATPVLTLKNASTGVVLAHIAPNELSARHVWVRWLYVPTAGTQLLMEYVPVLPYLGSDYQALPAFIPFDFLFWHMTQQAAADMERTELVRLSQAHLQEVLVNERQKILTFGDNEWQGSPQADEWDEIEGVD